MTISNVYSNEAARTAATALRHRIASMPPTLAIILGSGLGALVNEIQDAQSVPFTDIPGFSDVHVRGHDARMVTGTLERVPVVVFAGRFHLYEGHPPQRVGFPVRLAYALGARTVLVTNAAGGVGAHIVPGDVMIIEDHLNMTFQSPLVGIQDDGDARFPDMSDPYDATLRTQLHSVATALNLPVKTGVYAGVLGPAYETRAEIQMLRSLGAAAVGMSTVHEVITARALSMRIAGLSCITNMAAGLQSAPLDHADVLAGAARMTERFHALVRGFTASFASASSSR